MLSDALAGRSGVIVLRGEAGVGKSALLEYLADRVAGWHVASAVGIESEMELAYSGLHQLCGPMLDRLDGIPGPRARRDGDGVRAERGAGTGPVPRRPRHADPAGRARRGAAARLHRRRRALARRRLGPGARVRRPPSPRRADRDRERGALGHRRRRLRRPSRAGAPGPRRARRASAAARPPARPGRRRGVRPDRHRDATATRSRCSSCRAPGTTRPSSPAGSACPTASRSPGRSSRATRSASSSSHPTRGCFVLAAAAEPLGDPVLLHRAADTLGLDIAAAGPAVDAGLLKVGARVEFAHPLVRSAAYRSATSDDRHLVHRALADATDPETDPDRRAWHRARATPGPSEEVAAELERSADRAQARGGLAAAAAFLQRAVELADDPARRAERGLAAAQASFQAGAFDAALAAPGEHRSASDRRVRARAGRPRPGPRRLRLRLRQRRAPAAVDGRPRTRALRHGPRPRDVPGGVGRGGDRGIARREERPPRDLPLGAGAPPAERRPASARSAARRPRVADHRRALGRRADPAACRERARRHPARGRPAVGMDGDVREHAGLGHGQLPGDLGPTGPARARGGRGRPAPAPPLAAGAAAHVDRRLLRGGLAGGGERRCRRRDRAAASRRTPCCGSGRCKAEKRTSARWWRARSSSPTPSGRGSPRAVSGAPRSCATGSDATRRPRPRRRKRRRTTSPGDRRCGPCPSWSRRRRAAGTRTSPAARSSGSSRRRERATATSRAASRRAAARC